MRQPITEESGVHQKWYALAKKQTLETLPEFMRSLAEEYGHDYGTICHAVAASALGAAYAMNHTPQGGITGFQAGAVMWEFLSEWDHLRGKPARLQRFEELLYPQYDDHWLTISANTWSWLQEQARKSLAEATMVSPAVKARWESVARGEIPCGFVVDDPESEQYYGWRCTCRDGEYEHPYYKTPYKREDAQHYALAHKGKNEEHKVTIYARKG